MPKKIAFLFFVFIYQVGSAQMDDTLRTVDSTMYHVQYNGSGMINYTNSSRSYLLNNLLKFNIVRKRISLNTSNGWVYGSQQTGLTNNDFFSTVDVNLFKSVQKLYYWGLANYDKSYSLKINDRLQSGVGIAYSFFSKPEFNLIISDGALYEYTSLYDTTYQTVRNSFRIKYRIVISKIVALDGTNFWQQSIFDREDYILKFNNSLSLKLKSWLNFTVNTSYNKLNLSKNENFMCTIGLAFQKSFSHVRK